MFTTRIFYDENRVSSLDGESVSPEIPINNEPQDEDPILMASHQEGPQDEHEQPPPHPEPHPEHEHEPQPQPEPQSEPQPRRSARIKAKNKLQGAVPPNVKTPAKSTSRKRAARKK